MEEENNIKLQLSLEDTKLIFQALGKMPFEEVYELIGKLNEQVNDQNQDKPESFNH